MYQYVPPCTASYQGYRIPDEPSGFKFKFIHWQPQLEQSRWRCRLDNLHPGPQAVAAAEPRLPRRPPAGRHRGSHCPSGTGTPAPGPGPGDTVTGDSGPAEHSD